MRNNINDALNTIKNNFRSIFLFELIYRIIFFTIYIRISGKIIDVILENCGYSYLNIKNVFEVLKEPVTYPFLILLVLIAILFAGYEMSVLYTGFRSASMGSNMRIGMMLLRGFARYIRMFKPRNLVFLFINSLVFYVFEGYWIYKAAFISKRFSEIVRNLGAFKGAIAAIIIIGIILVLIAARYLFCTCYYMCSPNGHTNALKGGKGFWKGRMLRFILMYLAVTALYLIVYIIVHSILMVIVATLVVVFSPHSYEMALIDVIGRYINLILIYFGSIFTPILYAGLTISLFTRYEEDRSDIGKIEREASYNADAETGWKKRLLIIVSAVILIGTIVNIVSVIRTGNLTMSDAFGRIAITSHRGASSEAPENTIPSVEKAIETLSDYAEIDIRQTKDGKIILMHDPNLRRTTGVDKKVSELTLEEIEKIDAGAGFSRTYAGTKIPTFDEVLDVCKGKIKLNVEIKMDGGKEVGDFVADIVNIVKQHGMENQCVFTSTTYSVLKRIKGIDLDLTTGYIVAAGYGDYFQDPNLDFYSVSSAYMTESLVDKAHGYGKEVHVWTVNDRSELVRMKRIGVDNVITDDPVFAREVLYGEERTQSLVSYIKMLVK